MVKKKRSFFSALWTLAVVLASVCAIVWHILWRFERLGIPERKAYLRQWALKTLKRLGISMQVRGASVQAQRCLLAANHVSWIDILVLYAIAPCRFIAKSEVEHYPMIGRMAKNAGTLFLKRGQIKDAIRMSQQISEALRHDDCVAFFPEGTTTDGTDLLPLHASLFEGAIGAECPVQTVVLRYHTQGDTRACLDPAYTGTMFGSLWRTLRHGDIRVDVTAFAPMPVSGEDTRGGIAAQVQAQMQAVIDQLNRNEPFTDMAETQMDNKEKQ